MFEVIYRKKAVQSLRKVPADTCKRFFNAVDQLTNGNSENLDTKPLTGRDGRRLRIGGYRAVYTIDNDRLVILALDAGPRGDIYK